MIRVSNIKIYEDLQDSEIIKIICKKYKMQINNISEWHISKKSIDARKKDNVHYTYSVDIEIKNEEKFLKYSDISLAKKIEFPTIEQNLDKNINPVIVGAGPSGLFSALTFVENGYKPIVIEQGECVEKRKETVGNYVSTGVLNVHSNVQFGEGGAGTFSDGKLNSGISSPYCRKILEEFVRFGAPEQILYMTKPHIGTDNLIKIIKNMREYIISKGGKFLFNTKFVDFKSENNKISEVSVLNLDTNQTEQIKANVLILAVGHSSRETFKKIYEKGLLLEPKNFSVGVRIEHLQSEINESQYGTVTKLQLPSADYKLAYHSSSGRSCYTFCMCPGGVVMPSSSEKNTIVTNGMSYFARDGKNSNSALLVNVMPSDFSSDNPLAGIDFQKDLEEKAFVLGGSNYYAPIQRFEDFENNVKSTFIGGVEPTYKPGVTLSNLNEIMPDFVAQTLKEGIRYFDTKLHGFANPDSILTGMETRSSSPVRILRNENFVSNIDGIYPCGEGAGYAGGIMSAGVDGIKCAIAAMKTCYS